MSLSDRRHVDPPEDLDGETLVEEQRALIGLPTTAGTYSGELIRRSVALWEEIRERADTTEPECPECGSTHWGQVAGEPATCGYGHEAHADLEEEIHDAWDAMTSEVREADRDD